MLRYIILLACSWALVFPVKAQKSSSMETDTIPVAHTMAVDNHKKIRGILISADLFGYMGGLFDNDFTSSEIAVELNLKNRFFPVLEIGYGTTDTTDDDNDVHYKVSAPYFRIGANYNFYHKKNTPNSIFAGFRLAYSSFSYDVDAPDLTDPVWGGSVPFSYKGISSNASWLELVVGLRTQIYKNFHMGWSIRYKRRLSVKENSNSDAWYIPGFGENDSALFSATYNLIYYIPW